MSEAPITTSKPGPEPDAGRVTPMMAQYVEIKAANPDCLLFYRMGDFYELFFGDAEVASRALGIVLTKRGKHQGADIPMCGVPIERADDYLQRLIGFGHRVAVCEQIEDPAEAKKRGPKAVVRRDVVRLVTPGTITEDRLLEPGRANVLLAIARARASDESWTYGLASADISTGAFALIETSAGGLAAEIARIEPREIIASETLTEDAAIRRMLDDTGAPFVALPREASDATAERRMRDYFGVSTLDGFGVLTRAEIAAASTAIFYIERTQFAVRPPLAAPARMARGETMEIDSSTRANLELTRTLSGKREGSLLAEIDCCVTPCGSRLLAERIAGPLTDVEAIGARLDSVAFFVADPMLRGDLRASLKAAPDLERALSRIALQRGGPRDLAALRDGLGVARDVARVLAARVDAPQEIAAAARSAVAIDPNIEASLANALADELPLNKRDGGFIRSAHLAELDETRALRDESRRVIASLQQRYCEAAETRQLKIKHNNFLGFFIEVSQANGEKLLRPPYNAQFVHRQTMADAMRFSTSELGELEARIASAADRALALELGIFEQLAASVIEAASAIKAIAASLAVLDVSASLAEAAFRRDWVRPLVDRSHTFAIEAGRHPVVEAALRQRGDSFVANDCNLADAAGDNPSIALVTGPNMAGKSTYLRQNALVAVLAQAGSFVPARKAHIGVVDRLFSRVGAADDLARGRSTFMVEMVETAAILNQATERSLVILDEIGRGTATFDGLSIAWATLEHLHERNRSRALFATHFHELTQLTRTLKRLVNLTMRVTDWNGDVVFLHEVVQGAADRSYGIQVAKLAGLPPSVVERARVILRELEAGDRQAPVQRMIDDLPLFAAARATPPPAAAAPAVVDELRRKLDEIDPDELSPRLALEALYAIKRLRASESGR